MYVHVYACTCTCVQVIRLTALGAGVDARDDKGRTPLHMAARWGWSSAVEALVTLGADVRARDGDGLVPGDHAWYGMYC